MGSMVWGPHYFTLYLLPFTLYIMIPQTFTLKDRDGFTRAWEPTPGGHIRYSCFVAGKCIAVEYLAFADAMKRVFDHGRNAEILEIKPS